MLPFAEVSFWVDSGRWDKVPRRTRNGATTTSSAIAGKVCFQEAAKPISTAEMRRITDRQSLAGSGMAALGVRRTIADVRVGGTKV